MFCCCPTIIFNYFASIHWLLLRSESRAKWELLGLQTLTTTTRTNTGPTPGTFFWPNFVMPLYFWPLPGTFFVPKSYPCNFVPGSLGTQWSECSHQEPRAWIIRFGRYSLLQDAQFWLVCVTERFNYHCSGIWWTFKQHWWWGVNNSTEPLKQACVLKSWLNFFCWFFVWGNTVLT